MDFYGGAIPNYGYGDLIPDMGSLNAALAQNAAIRAAKPKKGFGDFLRNFAGLYGDQLTGNPVFAKMQAQLAEQQQSMAEYERKRQDELKDYEAKKGIDAQYSKQDLPGIVDEFKTAQQLGYVPKEFSYQDYLKLRFPGNFVPPSPVSIPYGSTVSGGDAGSPTGLPKVQDEAGYNALPPGATYIDPNGVIRKKGGPSQGGSGGFL